MRSWKSTLALLLITVGTGVYVSKVELKRPTVEERNEQAKEVARLDSDAVTALKVSGPSGEFELAKQGEAWRLTKPRAARADGMQVRRLLFHLDPVESERALAADTAMKLAEFGLEPPKASLTATAGAKTVTVLFGDKTPVGDHRYLKLADAPAVYVAAPRLFDAVTHPWDTYRSKDLVDVDAWDGAQVSVHSPAGAYTLMRDGERWKLTAPVDEAADQAAATGLITKLRNLRAEQFVSDEPAAEQLAAWGLEPAASAVTITVKKRETPLELRVGSAVSDRPEELYAKRADEPAVCSIKKTAAEDLWKAPDALRQHEILDVSPEDIVKAQVAWKGATWTIERKADGWSVSDAGTALEKTKVDEWLWKVKDFKLTKFADEAPQDLARYGLTDALGAIRVWTKDRADAKEVLIGGAVGEGRSRYARLTERRGIVVEVPEGIELLMAATPESFKPAPAAADAEKPAP